MGKPTGFLDDVRRDVGHRAAIDRVHDWAPFTLPLTDEARHTQAGRCMNCGVPYCQSGMEWEGKLFGCPLHNLIPEWNDMLYLGKEGHALTRLLSTNNFPEFTGRVCPAPCEAACICGIYGDSVTIHDNELAIIEAAFASGLMTPRVPSHRSGKTVAVVGAGPAGLACADTLNHRGHEVTIIEKNLEAGGLLTYGIPNMKLPKDIVARRVALMREEGVRFLTNTDASKKAVAQSLLHDFDAVVLCCGASEPRPVTFATKGIKGFYYATDYLKATVEREQFNLTTPIPSAQGKDVIVIGTGDTATDCVASALRQGAKSVRQLVRRKKEDYLVDGTLPQAYGQEEAQALMGEDPRHFSVEVAELVCDKETRLSAVITTQGEQLPCTLLLAATGFAGCADDVCAAFGVEHGRTAGDENFSTNVEKVFACGDMRRGASLVVLAISEGQGAAVRVDAYLNGYTNLL